MPITSWNATIALSELDAFLAQVDTVLQRYGSPTVLRLQSLQILEEALEEMLTADDGFMVSLKAGLWSGPLRFIVSLDPSNSTGFPSAISNSGHVQATATPEQLVLQFV